MGSTMAINVSVLATVLLIGNAPVSAAENLAATLRESGWDRMIGTWVDAQTNGKMQKSVTAWCFKEHVLETSNEDLLQGKKETALTTYNPKTAEVFYVSADDKGGSAIGKWTFTKKEAVLDMGFVTPEKQEGLLKLRYQFIDDDTLIVTVALPEPIEIKMIRVEEKGRGNRA